MSEEVAAPTLQKVQMREAIRQAMVEEMEADPASI